MKSEFEFGMVIGLDYIRDIRLLLIAPVVGIKGIRGGPGNWWAAVLHDPERAWPVGGWITVSPLNSGITIVEPEEDE